MRYIPRPPLDGIDDATKEYLQVEHERISDATRFPVVNHILVEQVQAEPAKPRDGMVAYADGTNWDPGCGAGFYRYKSSTTEWRYLEVKITGTGPGNSFSIIAISGQDNVVAEIADDTLTLIEDTKITLTTNATNDEITIQAKDFLDPDVTDNVTVGYTTDIEADTFTSPLVPDLTLEHFKTVTVTSNFTVNEPTTTGHCEYYLTVTGAGGYTITKGTGVKAVGTLPSLVTGTNYIMNVRRYGALQTVIQVVAAT